MMSFERMSSFFWSSPCTFAVPAAPMLARVSSWQLNVGTRAGRDAQVQEARAPDVGRDELARRLDRSEENRQVAGRDGVLRGRVLCLKHMLHGVSGRARGPGRHGAPR